MSQAFNVYVLTEQSQSPEKLLCEAVSCELLERKQMIQKENDIHGRLESLFPILQVIPELEIFFMSFAK